MNKLKVSWTILNAWESGKKDEAIQMIAGIEIPSNPAMERGKRIHNVIAKNKLKLLKEISDEAIYEDVQPDKNTWVNYFRVSINDWLDISLVIDVLDIKNRLIVDWKASRLRSTEHNPMQIYIYALAMDILGYSIDHGIFATVNEDDVDHNIFCSDYSMFKINEGKILLARNYIETMGKEIYDFLFPK